jgi:hypothetical protein
VDGLEAKEQDEMAVTINEVDVVPAQRSAEPAAEQDKGGGEQSPPSEHDVRRLVEQQASRAQRVWAH